MREILAGVMLALAVSVPTAKACEAVNRTREEVLEAQRHLASTADSIYLARLHEHLPSHRRDRRCGAAEQIERLA